MRLFTCLGAAALLGSVLALGCNQQQPTNAGSAAPNAPKNVPVQTVPPPPPGH